MGIPLTDRIPPEPNGETTVGFEHWLVSKKGRVTAISARYLNLHDALGQSAVEFAVTLDDGTSTTHRIPLGEGKVEEAARIWLAELEKLAGLRIPLSVE